MKTIYNELSKKTNKYIELVDDVEYFGKLIEGIIIYSGDGTCFQLFKDIDNKTAGNTTKVKNGYVLLNEDLAMEFILKNKKDVINETLKIIKGKDKEINRDFATGILISVEDFAKKKVK